MIRKLTVKILSLNAIEKSFPIFNPSGYHSKSAPLCPPASGHKKTFLREARPFSGFTKILAGIGSTFSKYRQNTTI